MKLAIITHYWLNSQGGVKEYTKNLVNALKRKGLNVMVLFREGYDKNNYKLSENKIKFVFEAIKILNIEKPDIVLTQHSWFTMIPAYLYKKHNSNSKIFALFHTQFDKKLPPYKRFFYHYLFNKFDKVGFVSRALERNVRDVAGLKIKKDTFILYAGAKVEIPTQEEIKNFREKYKIPWNPIILLGQSLTAHPLKAEGAKLLINAVRILKEKGTDVVLILTREGKFTNELRKYAEERKVADKVIFTGDVQNPYVPLAMCDIYTHITLGEGGLSVALLEAMAMGKTIIATPVGGIPEAIEDGKNGILVEPDAKKIAEKIEMLIKDNELSRRLGECARKTAEERFTWERTADDFLDYVEHL